MKKHVSRRELARRSDMGRQAIRTLVAIVAESGGTYRLRAAAIETLPSLAGVHVSRDGADLVFTAYGHKPVSLAPMDNAEWEKADRDAEATTRADLVRDDEAVRPTE